jgi:hypothetical protein
MPLLHAKTMPPMRQNRLRYTVLAREHHSTHTPNGWAYIILVRGNLATHTPIWTDQSEHYYPHATLTLKMDGPMPFLHATAMPPMSEWTDQPENYYLHATLTLIWIALCHSCTPPPCHPYGKMDDLIRTSLPPCHPYA